MIKSLCPAPTGQQCLNEEAGEHWTPRDAVKLMANLVFLPVEDAIQSGSYLLYDGACGTGGMLTPLST